MINRFKDQFAFLSNFYNSNQTIGGITYKSNECYFQAMKSLNIEDHKRISILSAGQAKRAGRTLQLRPDWEKIKEFVMLTGLIAKFKQNLYIRNLLLSTGNQTLIEGNYWHDNYWGDCYCNECKNIVGKNRLGTPLMTIRFIFANK